MTPIPQLLFSLLLPALALSAACTDIGGVLNNIADTPTGIIDQTIYLFPHICKIEGTNFDRPCHYYCNTQDEKGWQEDLNANHSISWSNAASAVGELEDGSEALFMLGGGPTKKPLNNMVYYSPKNGVVTLPPVESGPITYATATYIKPILYLIGGFDRKTYNEKVYRYDTTKLKWLSTSLKPTGTFTPRLGLSSTLLNGVIVTAGGHMGTGPSGRYSAAMEMLEVERVNGQDVGLKWHQGPSMKYPRAYAAMFNAGCRVYVAGGAMDAGKISKFAADLNAVEVYSTLSTASDSIADGQWSRTKNIKYNVSHVHAVVILNGETEQGMLIGGLSKSEPKNYLQVVDAACDKVEYPTLHGVSKNGELVASCNTRACTLGYLDTSHGSKTDDATCALCPGKSAEGACTAACGDSFGVTGKCVAANSTQRSFLLDILATTPVCKCAEFYGGLTCEECIEHRDGYGCKDCLSGRHGPMCAACPGLDEDGSAEDDVCGGHGRCRGDGSTSKLSDGGTCDCDSGWDDKANCTKCLENFYGSSCKVCTCEATIHNTTNAKECRFSDICSGHGNCSSTPGGPTCDCDAGWQGDECSDEINGGQGLGGGVIFLIVLFSGGAVIGGFILLKRYNDNLDNKENENGSPGNRSEQQKSNNGGYPTAISTNVQGLSNNPTAPLLNGEATGSYTYPGGDMLAPLPPPPLPSDDNLLAPLPPPPANSVGVVKTCPSCGLPDGMQDGTNFCGLCGAKVE